LQLHYYTDLGMLFKWTRLSRQLDASVLVQLSDFVSNLDAEVIFKRSNKARDRCNTCVGDRMRMALEGKRGSEKVLDLAYNTCIF